MGWSARAMGAAAVTMEEERETEFLVFVFNSTSTYMC